MNPAKMYIFLNTKGIVLSENRVEKIWWKGKYLTNKNEFMFIKSICLPL